MRHKKYNGHSQSKTGHNLSLKGGMVGNPVFGSHMFTVVLLLLICIVHVNNALGFGSDELIYIHKMTPIRLLVF
jgi:hypothetical protein